MKKQAFNFVSCVAVIMLASVGVSAQNPSSRSVFVTGAFNWDNPAEATIASNNCAAVAAPFAIGCPAPQPPRVALPITPESAGGAAFGVGMRLSPAVRASLDYTRQGKHDIHVYMAVNGVVNGDGLSAVSSSQVMGNVALDFAGLTTSGMGGFNPYVTGDFGFTRNVMDPTLGFQPQDGGPQVSISGGTTQYHPAFVLGAGLQYSFTKKVALDIGYRYLIAGEFGTPKTDNTLVGFAAALPYDCSVDCSGSAKLRANRLQVGLVYTFGQ